MTSVYGGKLCKLEDGTLTPPEFKHVDHFGVAYEAIQKYGYFRAA